MIRGWIGATIALLLAPVLTAAAPAPVVPGLAEGRVIASAEDTAIDGWRRLWRSRRRGTGLSDRATSHRLS